YNSFHILYTLAFHGVSSFLLKVNIFLELQSFPKSFPKCFCNPGANRKETVKNRCLSSLLADFMKRAAETRKYIYVS
ncbi:MAG: hypothetical protein KKG10_04865, partial [Proteobacteria bacterium]|nr:hypothetical protein [Pseudomonadota bacterium]